MGVLESDMAKEVPDSKMLCYCRNVDYGTVRAAIEETDASRIEQVMATCAAGTGCRTCHPEIQELIEEHRAKRVGFLTRFVRKMLSRG